MGGKSGQGYGGMLARDYAASREKAPTSGTTSVTDAPADGTSRGATARATIATGAASTGTGDPFDTPSGMPTDWRADDMVFNEGPNKGLNYSAKMREMALFDQNRSGKGYVLTGQQLFSRQVGGPPRIKRK